MGRVHFTFCREVDFFNDISWSVLKGAHLGRVTHGLFLHNHKYLSFFRVTLESTILRESWVTDFPHPCVNRSPGEVLSEKSRPLLKWS